MNPDPITAEQTYNVPIAVVWKAITDPEQMRQWFFEPMTDFRAEVGFETEFNVHFEGQDFLHQWKVTEVVAEERISYEWQYAGVQGESLVTWELSSVPNGTNLKISHSGGETFPQDNPIFSRESGQAGWNYFLHDSLKNYLEA